MNKAVTSKDDILRCGRKLISEGGIEILNMRDVAAECGVATGSVYNYFKSKAELVEAVVESVWMEILAPIDKLEADLGFTAFVKTVFEIIKEGDKHYGGFFYIHSATFASDERARGKELMGNCFEVLTEKFSEVLRNDENVNGSVFVNELSVKDFSGYVLTLLISELSKKKKDCGALIKMIEICIY